MRRKWSGLLAKIGTAAVATVVVVVAMLWLAGTFRRGKIEPVKLPEAKASEDFKTALVQEVEMVSVAEPVGTIEAEHQTSISARVVANVLEMKVNAGDTVKQGELLVALDDTAQKARLGQAKESLKAAEATRDYAQQEVDRRKNIAPGSISQSEREQWESKLNMAMADVARAKEGVIEAESALDDTQIRSPINGVIVDRLVEPGDQSAPGKPLLTVYDPSRLRVEASVRESDIERLSAGQKLTVVIDALHEERSGTVEQIVPAADPMSRSFLVKVHLANPGKLYPGMYARLRIPLDAQDRADSAGGGATRGAADAGGRDSRWAGGAARCAWVERMGNGLKCWRGLKRVNAWRWGTLRNAKDRQRDRCTALIPWQFALCGSFSIRSFRCS